MSDGHHMLLGRMANGLFWMHRYIERAENMARLVDAGLRMALTKASGAPEEWSSVLMSAGADVGFHSKYDEYSAETVADFMLRDLSNPSSVVSCINAARTNARMVRTALTRETWESVNEAWMNLRTLLSGPLLRSEMPAALDRIKRETALIRGAFVGTMLRSENFYFSLLGTYIERADNTARIVDVKYYVLLPSVAYVGSTLDNYQWESLLRSVSAHRSYRWVYDAEYKPANVTDFLILNQRMPRSLAFCYRNIADNLARLADDYGARAEPHELADITLKSLRDRTVTQIINSGLHEFLLAFIAQNNRLGSSIAETYNFN
jgi:uncharacterized alpha-E superfamily protein